MKEVILLLQADIDIQTAFNRYEEFQEGRGFVFMQQLDAALTLMRHHPRSAGCYVEPYRRMLIRDFPFGVFYEEQTSRIVVTAVVDLRQDPGAIHRRIFG